jgi:PleD family two-component response regulator
MGKLQRILVVAGADADRERAQRALVQAGYEADGVPNGADAFEMLMAMPYDLVVTDCCLDKLACPAMLTKLRKLGVKTPVLVWARADAPSLAEVLGLSGGACVDKAGSIDELLSQVGHVLNGSPPPSAQVAPEASPKKNGTTNGGILLIDERESEAPMLRALLDEALHFEACTTANDGLAHARKHKFDLVLFSADTSITNLTGIVAQFHLLLPESFIVGVVTPVRGEDPQAAVKTLDGLDFDEIILKPFTSVRVDRLSARYCSPWDELVVIADDVVRASARCRRKDHYKEYTAELKSRLEQSVRSLIDACFDKVIVDLSLADSLSPMDLAESLRRLKSCAKPFGVSVRFLVSSFMTAALRKFESSFGWERFDLFDSVEAARAAKV